jgi:predicted DCC family thiol-disulfide oxidoreductase YuxK
MTKATLIFDGDCSFCSSSARVLEKITRKKVNVTPYQRVDLTQFGLTNAECEQAVQFVSSSKKSSGHLAIADALIASRNLWSIAGLIMKLPVITSAGFLIYGWVSNNRHKLPGGTPACQIEPKGPPKR